MKILVTCNRARLQTKVDVTVLRQLELVPNFSDVSFHGLGWPGGEIPLENAIARFEPDLVFFAADFDYVPDIGAASKVSAIKAVCMQDYWHNVECRRSILDAGNFDILVTKNAVGVDSFLAGRIIHHIVNPSGFDEEIFRPDPRGTPIYDVLICGKLCDALYPFRTRLARVIKSCGDKLAIGLKEHPGYFDSAERQHDFCRMLNQSRVALGCTGTSERLHMQKLWEISATNAVCITDLNPCDPDYQMLQTHVWQVDPRWDDDSLRASLFAVVAAARSKPLASRFNSLVFRYATNRDRARQLVESLESVGERIKFARRN